MAAAGKNGPAGISPDEVVSAVESQNTQAASGAVGQAPSDGSEPSNIPRVLKEDLIIQRSLVRLSWLQDQTGDLSV